MPKRTQRTNPIVDAYVRARFNEILGDKPGQKTTRDAAEETRRKGCYISNATLSNVKNGHQGVGITVLGNVARWLGFADESALMTAAQEWASSTGYRASTMPPPPSSPPATPLERALARLAGLLSPEVEAYVRQQADGQPERSERAWVEYALRKQRDADEGEILPLAVKAAEELAKRTKPDLSVIKGGKRKRTKK